MTLILMGDWCSEENTDTSTNEISASVKTLKASKVVLSDLQCKKKKLFLAAGDVFSLDNAF
jgi:hypothetical protein